MRARSAALRGRAQFDATPCATILKAFFNANYVLPHPVEATADGSARKLWRGAALTLGNEIDKLASNIALGRDDFS